jgi:hypothetical protein
VQVDPGGLDGSVPGLGLYGFRPTLQCQHDDAETKQQTGRQQLFERLLERLLERLDNIETS